MFSPTGGTFDGNRDGNPNELPRTLAVCKTSTAGSSPALATTTLCKFG